jgi:hypothetical protein
MRPMGGCNEKILTEEEKQAIIDNIKWQKLDKIYKLAKEREEIYQIYKSLNEVRDKFNISAPVPEHLVKREHEIDKEIFDMIGDQICS